MKTESMSKMLMGWRQHRSMTYRVKFQSVIPIALPFLLLVIAFMMDYACATTVKTTKPLTEKKQIDRSMNFPNTTSSQSHHPHKQQTKHHNHNHHYHHQQQHHNKANRVKKSGNNGASIFAAHRLPSEIPLHGTRERERKPNIILILTDDQDVELGNNGILSCFLQLPAKLFFPSFLFSFEHPYIHTT